MGDLYNDVLSLVENEVTSIARSRKAAIEEIAAMGLSELRDALKLPKWISRNE